MGYEKFRRRILAPGFSEGATTGNPAGGIQSSEINANLIQYASTPLTAVNIQGMFATPVSILAAPGAGKAIIIDAIALEVIATATQFASGGAVQFNYHGGVSAHTGTVPASVVNATAGTTLTQLGPAVGANGLTVPANTGIDITNATGAFTTGTGTAKVFLTYHVVTL